MASLRASSRVRRMVCGGCAWAASAARIAMERIRLRMLVSFHYGGAEIVFAIGDEVGGGDHNDGHHEGDGHAADYGSREGRVGFAAGAQLEGHGQEADHGG